MNQRRWWMSGGQLLLIWHQLRDASLCSSVMAFSGRTNQVESPPVWALSFLKWRRHSESWGKHWCLPARLCFLLVNASASDVVSTPTLHWHQTPASFTFQHRLRTRNSPEIFWGLQYQFEIAGTSSFAHWADTSFSVPQVQWVGPTPNCKHT